MMPSRKILASIFIIGLSPLLAFAQQFNYTAKLGPVDTAGFYSITISPQLSAYIKTDLADIRISDQNNQWIPHILQPANPVFMEDLFTAFPIMRNTVTDSGKNLLIVENTKAAGINNLKLFLKNAAISRTAVLSGSNNQRDWFIIDDKIVISGSYETVKDEYLQELNFPLAKYRYLKLIIDNAHNDALLITKAGLYTQPDYEKLKIYQDNPISAFTQRDSNKCSYIEVRQDINCHFDKISLSLSGSKFYSRDVEICLPDFGKSRIAKPGRVLGYFKLQSAFPSIFELPRIKTGLFFIIIKNADNPPLKIEKVFTQQHTVSLITYLQQGKNYHLLLGDSMASFADYDLQTFKDSISILRALNYGEVHAIKKNTFKNTVINTKRWIWPAIILAIIMLSFLTYRLTGDINKSKK